MNNEKMVRLKKVEIEILDFVVDICNQNKITYYLAYGTLLGAVRHKGFIPWDDDIDIVVPRADYDELCRLLNTICNNACTSKFYFQNANTDLNFKRPYSKVRKRNTIFQESGEPCSNGQQGIFIDIFPLDTVRHQRGIQKLFSFFIFRLLHFRQKTDGICTSAANMMTTWYKKGNYYVVYGSPYKVEKDLHKKIWFENGTLVEFEGKQYNAPKDYDNYLKQLYDDYMQLPPKDKRINHNPKVVEFGDVLE